MEAFETDCCKWERGEVQIDPLIEQIPEEEVTDFLGNEEYYQFTIDNIIQGLGIPHEIKSL